MALSDRIGVMSKGRLVRIFEGAEATEEEVVAASAAGHAAESREHREEIGA